MRELPILFNTEMVRAILDDRKTCTRRVVKYDKADDVLNSPAKKENPDIPDKQFIKYLVKMPYEVGDILYVRETWTDHYIPNEIGKPELQYCYKADGVDIKAECLPGENNRWYPSIHMPKEAARIWLKVTDVRVERLQDITEIQAQAEGCNSGLLTGPCNARGQFENLWNRTIKKSDLDIYGWKANPWVWVIEFERCEKPGKENLNETDRCR